MCCHNTGKIAIIDVLYIVVILLAVMSIISSFAGHSVWAKPYHKTVNASICESNLRQIGVALSLYCEDNDGRYPAQYASMRPSDMPESCFDGYTGKENLKEIGAFPWLLRDYSKRPDIWICPAGPKRRFGHKVFDYPSGLHNDKIQGGVACLRGHGLPAYTNYMSFVFNIEETARHCARGITPEEFAVRSKDLKEDPSTAQIAGRLITDYYMPTMIWVHGGGCNTLYYDGHVEWVTDPRAYRPQ